METDNELLADDNELSDEHEIFDDGEELKKEESIEELIKQLAELESRVVDAESRADNAEDQVRVMERRLGEVDWSPSEVSKQAEQFQKGNIDKEKVIKVLEGEVETQRQMRLSDAKQVEAKAARIKEWVTNKLRELEEQNAHLREQNAYCNEQMELLKVRLEQLQEMGATVKSRRESTQEVRMDARDSSLGSFEGEPGASTESLEATGLPRTTGHSPRKALRQRPLTSAGPPTTDPLYAEVDYKKKKRPPSAFTGPARHKTQSADPTTMTSSLLGMDELAKRRITNNLSRRDSRVDSGSVDLETPLELSPKSPLEALDDALNAVMPNRSEDMMSSRSIHKQPIPPPRQKGPPKKSKHEHLDELGNNTNTSPAKHNLMKVKSKKPLMSDELHDYSEIYTPSKEARSWDQEMVSASNSGASGHESMSGSSSVRTGSGDSGLSERGGHHKVQAPPLPIHKYPSWEDRIYQVATDGLSVSADIVIGAQIDSKNNNNLSNNPIVTGGYGTDINIPVYATVKGRASQIRSMPFTGESSDDSSDGEEIVDGRDTSFDSDASNDYAIPPDASVDSLAPPVSARTSFMDSPRKGAEKALEKSGYLTKLGGKIKSWRKRYFVLKAGVLSYWKSQHDLHRKPQGLIVLNESCRVSRADGSNTFEIDTGGKHFYLTADSQPLMEEWVRVLQNVVQRNALKLLLSREDHKPTLQGWLTKVKHGHTRKCWCVLIGKMFIYFRTPNDQNPMGQLNMRDTRVEEVEHISDSDSDSADPATAKSNPEPTLGIFPNHVHQDPTYLIFPNKQDQEKWLYQLTVVSGGDPKAGTQFEQLVQKLMEVDGDPSSPLWRHPLMVYSKETIPSPLTTFTSETLQAEAIKLFKSVQLFISVVLNSAGIDYHVVLAQNALHQVLEVPELQQELLVALAKQTSKHVAARHGVQVRKTPSIKHPRSFLLNASNLFSCDSSVSAKSSPPTTPTSATQSESKTNPPNCVFIQGWMLMAMAVSLFIPKNSKLLWFLRTHFNRNKDSKTEAGKYAAYCIHALERTVANGPRIDKPSRMEVLSILLKNPHHHSLPHALPVHTLVGTYHVIGFDGSTTIAEFLYSLNEEIGCRSIQQSGFAIFSDDPIEKDLDHCLNLKDKVCDVISRWETALREKGSGKFENKRVIRFTYKNRMFWRRTTPGETDRERLLFCYQISNQIVQGRFPLNKELAFELAALMAQIDLGDLNSDKTRSSSSSASNCLLEALERFYPLRYQENVSQEERSELENCLAEKWSGLARKSVNDCVRILLTCTRKWQYFGATLFQVTARQDNSSMWLAINEDGLSLLDSSSMQVLRRYSYTTIVTFGGCQDDFMLVVTNDDRAHAQDESTEKLVFSTTKPKILEITLLIADYMNMMGHLLPVTPKTTAATRAHSRSTSRSRLTATNLTSAPSTPRLDRDKSRHDIDRAGSDKSGHHGMNKSVHGLDKTSTTDIKPAAHVRSGSEAGEMKRAQQQKRTDVDSSAA